MPRVIYINCRTRSSESFGEKFGRKVEKTLPRGRPCLNLYEVELSEQDFIGALWLSPSYVPDCVIA